MKKDNVLRHIIKVARLPLFFAAIMAIIKLVEQFGDFHLYLFGIHPRRLESLVGIFSAPLIHGDLQHLYNNLTSFIPLSFLLLYFYPKRGTTVFFVSYVMTGLLIWIGARPSFHIGASGWIYAIASYLFFNGIFDKSRKSYGIIFVVVMFYGSMVWGVLPLPDYMRISWEGHLFGAITGLFLAYQLPAHFKRNRKKYSWQKEKHILNNLEQHPVTYEEVSPKSEEDSEEKDD